MKASFFQHDWKKLCKRPIFEHANQWQIKIHVYSQCSGPSVNQRLDYYYLVIFDVKMSRN